MTAERPTLDFFPGGKLPAQPARPHLKANRFLDSGKLPAPPAAVDWLKPVPSWPMYGNDNWGDCVFAEIGHAEQQISLLGQGAEVRVTNADVLGGYSVVTGFNADAGPPGDNPTDQGTFVQDALAWWRKTGIAGHQILAYAYVDPSDLTLVKQCIDIFGSVSIGFNFPASAMTQFNRGLPWEPVAGSAIQGGHCVMVGGYDAKYLNVVTWGALQKMSYAFWAQYCDEAWVVIDDEMVNRMTSKSFSTGVDLAAFAADFTTLTGTSVPLPAPTPTPDPAALEPASPADRALRKALTDRWIDSNALCARTKRKAAQVWRGTKNWS
jgi:hypothetical protein